MERRLLPQPRPRPRQSRALWSRRQVAGQRLRRFRASRETEAMHLANYLGLVHRSEMMLAEAFRQVATAHQDEADVFHLCQTLATQCDQHTERLKPFVDRYGEEAPDEPERL